MNRKELLKKPALLPVFLIKKNRFYMRSVTAAWAFGQRPLVMIEEGIERHYVGFVQNDDQIIYFNMADFSAKVEDVVKRIDTIYKKYLGQDLI
jgi:hypothetical protein